MLWVGMNKLILEKTEKEWCCYIMSQAERTTNKTNRHSLLGVFAAALVIFTSPAMAFSAPFVLAQYAPGYQPQISPQSQPAPLPGPTSGYNQDVALARQAQMKAATSLSGQKFSWQNPQTGTSGAEWAVGAPTTNNQGMLCRQVQEVLVIAGQQHSDSGYLCYPANYFR